MDLTPSTHQPNADDASTSDDEPWLDEDGPHSWYVGNEDVTPGDDIPTELVMGRHGWERRQIPAAKWARIQAENIAAAKARQRVERAREDSRPIVRTAARRSSRSRSRRAAPRRTGGASSPSAPPPSSLDDESTRSEGQSGAGAGRTYGAAAFTESSTNRKVAPGKLTAADGRRLPSERAKVATTNTSIASTCSSICPFKDWGCYVQAGLTKFRAKARDRAADGHTPEEVIAEEVGLIDAAFRGGPVPQDGARGGRDLRLHEGGDVGSVTGAFMLAAASQRWLERGGGQVWTYTHLWRTIPRTAWGSISVFASVETAEDIELAREAGYAAAIVVERFPSEKAFRLPGSSARVIPCPAETRGVTCATCRLCIDRDLLGMNAAIAFDAHGGGKRKVIDALVTLGRKKPVDESGASVAHDASSSEGCNEKNEANGESKKNNTTTALLGAAGRT